MKMNWIMENLFNIPPKKHSDSRCRECKHIANLNPHSGRYWYCTIQRCNRTTYGLKAVKRMDQACDKFENICYETWSNELEHK